MLRRDKQLITKTQRLIQENRARLDNQPEIQPLLEESVFLPPSLQIFKKPSFRGANRTNRESLLIFLEHYATLMQQIVECYQSLSIAIINKKLEAGNYHIEQISPRTDAFSKAYLEKVATSKHWYQPEFASAVPAIRVTPSVQEGHYDNQADILLMLKAAFDFAKKLTENLKEKQVDRFLILTTKFALIETELFCVPLYPWEGLAGTVNGNHIENPMLKDLLGPIQTGVNNSEESPKSYYKCLAIIEAASGCEGFANNRETLGKEKADKIYFTSKIQAAVCLADLVMDVIKKRINTICSEENLLKHKSNIIIVLNEIATALRVSNLQFDLWLESKLFPLILLPWQANVPIEKKLALVAILDIYFSHRIEQCAQENLAPRQKQNVTFIKRVLLQLQACSIFPKNEARVTLLENYNKLILLAKLIAFYKDYNTTSSKDAINKVQNELAFYGFRLPANAEHYIPLIKELEKSLECLPQNPELNDFSSYEAIIELTATEIKLSHNIGSAYKLPEDLALLTVLLSHLRKNSNIKLVRERHRDNRDAWKNPIEAVKMFQKMSIQPNIHNPKQYSTPQRPKKSRNEKTPNTVNKYGKTTLRSELSVIQEQELHELFQQVQLRRKETNTHLAKSIEHAKFANEPEFKIKEADNWRGDLYQDSSASSIEPETVEHYKELTRMVKNYDFADFFSEQNRLLGSTPLRAKIKEADEASSTNTTPSHQTLSRFSAKEFR